MVRFTESTKILNEKSKSDIEFSYFQGTQKAILVRYMLGLLVFACFVPKESFLLSNFSSMVEDEKRLARLSSIPAGVLVVGHVDAFQGEREKYRRLAERERET